MKLHQRGLELISLDRLIILENRVLLTINEYETLLNSLEKTFKNSNTQQIEYLQELETNKCKTLNQRVRIYKSYLKILKKNNRTVTAHESDVYNRLNVLYEQIKVLRENLSFDKDLLGREMAQVKKIIRPLGKLREETAGRIDITT